MLLIDHLFVLMFAVGYPLLDCLLYRKGVRQLEGDGSLFRKREYATTMIVQWTLLVVAVFIWSASDRSWELIGIHTHVGNGFWIALGLVALVLGLMLFQFQLLKRSTAEQLEQAKASLADVLPMLPHTRQEVRMFYGVSFTAGVVEEVLWRGVLIWYLGQFFPLWLAAALSVLAFALAHSYQGIRQVPRVAVIGAILTGLYLLSGSLWIPILLHIVFDMAQGKLSYIAINATNKSTAATDQLAADVK